MPAFLPDVPEVREDFTDYIGEAMAYDTAVGMMLEKLEQVGEYANTLVAMTGDHGPPGFPHGKCNLYDFGTNVALAVKGPGVTSGRVVDDFTMIQDLAPTFLSAASIPLPTSMSARDLRPLLESSKNGLIDPKRDAAFTGRERHVGDARPDQLAYPMRAIRTAQHLLILNFKPDRWPMGYDAEVPTTPELLASNTFLAYADMDASPTKAWLLTHREDALAKPILELAFGKRPDVELYDLKKDPDQVHNVASQPEYAAVVTELKQRLLAELKETKDPRIVEADGGFFEKLPKVNPRRPKKP
jgi:N-sulfoglucosamine sulfohydrolase